jgi:hypothetical protein
MTSHGPERLRTGLTFASLDEAVVPYSNTANNSVTDDEKTYRERHGTKCLEIRKWGHTEHDITSEKQSRLHS